MLDCGAVAGDGAGEEALDERNILHASRLAAAAEAVPVPRAALEDAAGLTAEPAEAESPAVGGRRQ